MQLNDRIAVITGAASGIGKEIATAFIREGAKVAIADRWSRVVAATEALLDAHPGGPD